MQQDNVLLYNPADETGDDFNINLEKIWKAIMSRKVLLIKVFCSVLAFFVLLTFILPKKYVVKADLYVNKSNNSNMMEVNPYVLDDTAGSLISMGADKAINNEMELIKSSLVLDKVVKENNLVYKKKFGIIPNKKEGELLSAEDFYSKGKYLKIENIKNTNVITVEYKAKKPELAYGVISSLITNYVDLHKELNAEKAKSDKQILEAEYAKIKKDLDKKLNQSSGLPVQSMSGIGNLSAMSAFSKSASRAMGNIKGQYVAGERSQIAVTEESQKLAQLAAKLEWAKLVDVISDSSKVLVINEPLKPRPFENSSPKLLINIILGCVFGYLAALCTLIYVEFINPKLTYTMLSDNILYLDKKNYYSTMIKIQSFSPEKVQLISFVQLPKELENALLSLPNISLVYFSENVDFINKINDANKIALISKINDTDSANYKVISDVIRNKRKTIVYDILV